MARIRSIKPVFWDDSKLSKISRDARLLFIGIWSFADDLGVVIAEPAFLKARIFPYDNLTIAEVEKWLSDLLKFGFIVSIEHKGERFFVICNFAKHQRIDKPNHCDVNISKELLAKILQSKIDPRPIPEPSKMQTGSIAGGGDRIGEEGKGKEGRGGDGKATMTKEDFIKFQTELIQEKLFVEQIMSSRGIRELNVLFDWIKAFNVHITGEGKLEKDYDEYRRHFKNWIVLQDTTKAPPVITTNGTTAHPTIKKATDEVVDKYRRKNV